MGLIIGKKDSQVNKLTIKGIEPINVSELQKGDLFIAKSSGNECIFKAQEDATKCSDETITIISHEHVVIQIIDIDSIKEVTTYGERDRA